MGMSVGGSKKGARADINVTPLIDIVLVVLIIMMVSIPIQVNEMGVKVPSLDPNQPPPPTEPNPDQLVLAMYKNGTLALNRELMTQPILFNQITRRLRSLDKKNVFIDADPEVPYGRVVDMLDLSRQAGAEKVGLAKIKEAGPAEATRVHPGTMERGVFPGTPKATGAMTAETADLALQPILGSVRKCYDAGLAKQPEMTGRIMAKIAVAPDGSQMSAKVTQSDLDPDTTACIEAILPRVAFKPLGPQNTALVLYPLVFSPG